IGREAALQHVREWIAQSRRDPEKTPVLLLSGEAGIGKSRLVEYIEQVAADTNFVIVRGNSFEQDRTLPYAPFRDLKIVPSEHTSASSFRSLRPKFAASPRGTLARDPEMARRHLFDEAREALSLATRDQAVLLILEDLDWSDDATLDLLLYLVRQTRPL